LVKNSSENSCVFDSLKSPYIYQEDGVFNPSLLTFKDFSFFSHYFSYLNSEESYEPHKNLSFVLEKQNISLILNSNFFFKPLNFSTVLDFFRSDFDEFS